jgi:16S rRNA (cytosine1402-N4)-methyltransferase
LFFSCVRVPIFHVPVLAERVERFAHGRTRAVDCTAGGGGHAAVFVQAGLEVLVVDRDPEAVAALQARLGPAVTCVHGSFGDPDTLSAIMRFRPDLAFFDLGISSHQLDQDERGFTFRPGAPLDMRMGGPEAASAADVLNQRTDGELERVFRDYGDEPRARRLAREIVRRRARQPFATSDDLVNAIRGALGPRTGAAVFARLFQAVRIEVNNELAELEATLPAVLQALCPGGDLAVITYHSGEDRIVKHLFLEWARACVCPPHQPVCTCRGEPWGTVLTKRPLVPTAEEIAANPRARSAKLRVFRKSDAS